MKKFFNFLFLKKAFMLVMYIGLLLVMISDIIVYSNTGHTVEMIDSHTLNWWTMFLILDIWYFHRPKDTNA